MNIGDRVRSKVNIFCGEDSDVLSSWDVCRIGDTGVITNMERDIYIVTWDKPREANDFPMIFNEIMVLK